jgi:GntR family transcriptional repressor for pyruvate dehydrogenase complex
MITKDSIPNLIIDQIKNSIQEGKIKPGDVLPTEQEIAQIMNVGKNSVREALAALEYMDIITKGKNGIVVNTSIYQFFNKGLSYHFLTNKDKLIELYELRRVLEPQIARLAAERASEDDLKTIEQCLVATVDKFTSYQQDHAFHTAISAAIKNKVLMNIYRKIQDLILLVNDWENNLNDVSRHLEFHEEIYSAIRDGDGEIAARVMLEHVNDSYKDINFDEDNS